MCVCVFSLLFHATAITSAHQNAVDFFKHVCEYSQSYYNFFPCTFFIKLTNHMDLHTKLLLTKGNSAVSSRREIRVATLICKQQSIQPKMNWSERFEQQITIGLHYNPRNSIHIHESILVQISDGMKYWGGRTALPHRRIRLMKVEGGAPGWLSQLSF